MLKLKLQFFGHLMQRVNPLEKTLLMGKIEGRRRRGRQRTIWLDGITDSMDKSSSNLRERMKDRKARHVAVHGATKSWTQLSDPLTPMDRSIKQKISKETQTLNYTMDQLDLIDIHRTVHPKTMNFTCFSSAHGTFSRIDHILGHKSSLDKLKKKIEIISSIFSDHNAVRLDVKYRKKKNY